MTSTQVPTARDIMSPVGLMFSPDNDIFDVIHAIVRRRVSGAPVVRDDALVGFISEKDCLKMLSSGTFHQVHHAHVADFMTPAIRTVNPERDIYSLASIFLNTEIRRLPVVEDGRMIGQVSRRNVLVGMDRIHREEQSRQVYPDYRQPT